MGGGGAEEGPAEARAPWQRSFRVVWPVTYLAFVALGACWVFSSPLGSGPDEIEHVVKAAGTVRGEWIGTAVAHHAAAFRWFTVPGTYSWLGHQPICDRLSPALPAGCAPPLATSARVVRALSYVGRYPPAYPAAVGLPTVVSSSVASLWAMRLVGLVVCAGFTSAAVALAAAFGGPLVVAGAVGSLTPSALYLSGVVHPDGVEIAASLLVWTALLLLARDEGAPRRLLVHAAGASAVAVVAVRATGPLWLAVALVVAFALVAPPRRAREVLADRTARAWAVVVGVATAGQLVWMLAARDLAIVPVSSARRTTIQVLGAAVEHLPFVVGGLVAPNHPFVGLPPAAVVAATWAGLAVVVGLGLWLGHAHDRLAMAAVAGFCLVFPIVTIVADYRTDGIVWQGRQLLPVAIGLPLVAATAAARVPRGAAPPAICAATGRSVARSRWGSSAGSCSPTSPCSTPCFAGSRSASWGLCGSRRTRRAGRRRPACSRSSSRPSC